MSTSVPERVSAEITIGFGHGGEASIKLSTLASGSFTEDRLQETFSRVSERLADDLNCISHDCPLNTSDQSVSDSRHLPLVVMETEFVAEIHVSIGEFAIPFDNVYYVVQMWLYMGLIHQVGEDIKLATGIAVNGDETRLGQRQALLSGLGIVVSLS